MLKRKKEEEAQLALQNQQLREQIKTNQENARSRMMAKLKEEVSAVKQTIKVRSLGFLRSIINYKCSIGDKRACKCE